MVCSSRATSSTTALLERLGRRVEQRVSAQAAKSLDGAGAKALAELLSRVFHPSDSSTVSLNLPTTWLKCSAVVRSISTEARVSRVAVTL